MSLQVWLPLTGDLRQQGLSNAEATVGTTITHTWENVGKIGNNSSKGHVIVNDPNLINTFNSTHFSICFWCNIAETTTAGSVAETYVISCGTSGTRTNLHIPIRVNGGAMAFCFYSDDYTFLNSVSDRIGTWMHVACIYNNRQQIVYINGKKIGERTANGDLNIAANQPLHIYSAHTLLNDLRIYDHALTEKEVKEISCGLVLHYPLNDRYVEPTANIITSLRAGGRTVVVDGDKIQNTGENVDTYFYLVTPKLVAGKTYTLSYYCQGLSDSDPTWQFGVGAQSSTHANHCGYIPIRNGWNELTFICPESLDGNTLLILDDYTATWRTSIITISQIQLESGSTRTPYTPFNTVSDGTTNLLTGNAKKISTWTNYMPSYVTLSEDSEGCKYTLLQGVGGWEKIFTDAIPVETGKSYTLSFDYTVEQNYNGYSGSFGLSVCTTSQAAYGNDTNVLAQLQFGTSQLSRRRGYITFTATTDEVYLVANGGRIADGQENISFVIDKLILAESIVFDISGYQHNGVINNALGTSADTPRYRSCIDIVDGSYIDTSLTENIGVGDFSVSVWIKMPQTSGKTYQPIFSNKTTGAASNGFAIYFNQNQNKLLWSTADGTNATEIWTANTVDLYDKWMHIVMVRNFTDARKGYFYINGERWELASIPPIRDISNDEYTIKLGDIATHTNSAYRYVGLMSDFRLYTTALSADDIKELYEMGVA